MMADSDEMPTWRSLASSRLSSFKGYLTQQDVQRTLQISSTSDSSPHGWKLWGKKHARSRNNDGVNGTDQISLFPGWATRRYRVKMGNAQEAFEVEVFVSGFATSHKGPQFASRSQRAFMRLAKGFAAIPKLAGDPGGLSSAMRLSPSTEELLASVKLPPRPTEITEDLEIQALEEQFRKMHPTSVCDESDTGSRCNSPTSRSSSTSSDSSHEQKHPAKQTSAKLTHPHPSFPSDLRKLHDNLESRLQPFWSTALSARTVRVHVTTPSLQHSSRPDPPHATHGLDHGPVVSQDVQTTSDGYFQVRFKIVWEDLCQHPGAMRIAFGGPSEEHDLLVLAELLPPHPPRSLDPSSSERSHPSTENCTPTATSGLLVPVTHSPVRLISDIDDTVKFSNILSGARAVFRNVFVKEYHDIIIPGMGEWYNQMWKRGVRFHYVSNGPFELLPVVNEFFRISQLPRGSIKLRSYAGRSLFNGLLSAPATRKRSGIIEVLEHFAESKFLLVGDTGEQDLELYAAFARERPWQVVGVFVRDVNANVLLSDGSAVGGMVDPIDDPTGSRVMGPGTTMPVWVGAGTPVGSLHRPSASSSSSSFSSSRPTPSLTIPTSDFSNGYFTSIPSPLSAEPENYDTTPTPMPPPQAPRRPLSVSSMSSSKRQTSDPTRKRQDLQSRVWAARSRMPGNIPLRVFRSPEECVEVGEILDRLSLRP